MKKVARRPKKCFQTRWEPGPLEQAEAARIAPDTGISSRTFWIDVWVDARAEARRGAGRASAQAANSVLALIGPNERSPSERQRLNLLAIKHTFDPRSILNRGKVLDPEAVT